MTLQFTSSPSEDDIMMAHTTERYFINYRAGQMTDRDIEVFFNRMFESAQKLGLETSPAQQAIPVTYNLFYEIWHEHLQNSNRITPYTFQKRHRKYLIFSGASQAVMLMFGMMPSQVILNRWTSADRTYLAENLQIISANVGRKDQLLCPRPHFFSEWRRLAKLVDFIDVVQAMPATDYVLNHGYLREYIRHFPEKKWLAARATLPSDLF